MLVPVDCSSTPESLAPIQRGKGYVLALNKEKGAKIRYFALTQPLRLLTRWMTLALQQQAAGVFRAACAKVQRNLLTKF